MSAQQCIYYCHKDIRLDYMFRLTSSHHQVYTGEYKNLVFSFIDLMMATSQLKHVV